jgi:hypothetical protein
MRGGTRGAAVWLVIVGLVTSSCAAANGDDRRRDVRRAPNATTTTTARPNARPASRTVVRADRPPELTFRRKVTKDHPLRVGFVGDSVAYSLIPTLTATAEELLHRRALPFTTVGGFTGPGFGLTADVPGHNDIGPTAPPEAYAGWRDAITRMVQVDDPDLVLVLLGIWDTIERRPGGRSLAPGMPEWDWWYGLLASEFVKALTARGASVIWLVMPCVGRPDVNARVEKVNAVLRRTWRAAPGRVGSIELSQAACRDGAPIRTANGPWGPFTVREADGIHFRPLEAPWVLRPFLVRRFLSLLRGVKVVPKHSRVV